MDIPEFNPQIRGVDFSQPLDQDAMSDAELVDVLNVDETLVDFDLIGRGYEREEVRFAKLIASGCPREFVTWFLSKPRIERHGFATAMMQLYSCDVSKLSLDRVDQFVNTNAQTRERALNLRSDKRFGLYSYVGFHYYMKQQPRVALAPVPLVIPSEDNNNRAPSRRMALSYSSGPTNFEVPVGMAPYEVGRESLREVNAKLKEMFQDLPSKPEVRVVDDLTLKLAAQMLLVAKFKIEENGEVHADFIPKPLYRPSWKKNEVEIPPDAVAYFHSIWNRVSSKLRKSDYLEIGNPFDYLVGLLDNLADKRHFRDILGLQPYSAVEMDFKTQLTAALAPPDARTLADEIKTINQGLTRSRGFRGPRPELDYMTHAMFEVLDVAPISYGSADASHARLVGVLDQNLIEIGAKTVVAFDSNASGPIKRWFNLAKAQQLAYSLNLRAEILGNEKPVHAMDGSSGFMTPVDFDQSEQRVLFAPDVVVWLERFEDAPADKSYLEVHEASYKVLKSVVDTYKPKYTYVPWKLSYLNLSHPLGVLIATSEEAKMLPVFSRGHNGEVWFRLKHASAKPGQDLAERRIVEANAVQVLAGRRLRLANWMRDYLISAGDIHRRLGYTVNDKCLLTIMRAYCYTKVVTESQKAAVSSLHSLPVAAQPVRVQVEGNLFPEFAETAPEPPRARKPATPSGETGKRQAERSPSVDSQGSGRSVGSNDNRGSPSSWYDEAGEDNQPPLIDKRVTRSKKADEPAKKTSAPKKTATVKKRRS